MVIIIIVIVVIFIIVVIIIVVVYIIVVVTFGRILIGIIILVSIIVVVVIYYCCCCTIFINISLVIMFGYLLLLIYSVNLYNYYYCALARPAPNVIIFRIIQQFLLNKKKLIGKI